MENQGQNQQQINIELTEEMVDGTYANLAIVNHSVAEFVLDFINLMPGNPKPKVKSRIVMTPFHAKRLMRVLVENIKGFESVHGIIKDQEVQGGVPFNFNGPAGEA
jgi:hypothetical protein